MTTPTLQERFAAKVNLAGPTMPHMTTPCHVWTACTDDYGYGRLGRDRAHRVAFFLAEGRWPEPCALHRCDHPPCVRRDHLFEGTRRDNMADMTSKGRGYTDIGRAIEVSAALRSARTHCKHGHKYDEANTYMRGRTRHCRACRTIACTTYYERGGKK